jgi:hypothetical protein
MNQTRRKRKTLAPDLERLDSRVVPVVMGNSSAFLGGLASVDPFLPGAVGGTSTAAVSGQTQASGIPFGLGVADTLFGLSPEVGRFRGVFGLGLPSSTIRLGVTRAATRFQGNFGVGVPRTTVNTNLNGLSVGFQPLLPISAGSRVFGGFLGNGQQVQLGTGRGPDRVFQPTRTFAGRGLAPGSIFESSPAFAPPGSTFSGSPTFAPPSSTFGASPTFAPAGSIFDSSPTFAPVGSIFGASPSFATQAFMFAGTNNTGIVNGNTAQGILGPNSLF